MVLGLIPARGGSKGVPRKNIRSVCSKPLIAYAIQCGLNCSSLDHLIVSTDDPEIAEISENWGADVPFLRPSELAEDTTPMLPVMQHAIVEAEKYYENEVGVLVLLDPTAPLRTVDDIENSLRLFRNSDCSAVISGNAARRSPYFNMVVPKDGFVRLAIFDKNAIGCRQDSPPVFDLNTVVWIYSRSALMEERSRIPQKTVLYEVPAERAIDLDTELDFKILQALMDASYNPRSD